MDRVFKPRVPVQTYSEDEVFTINLHSANGWGDNDILGRNFFSAAKQIFLPETCRGQDIYGPTRMLRKKCKGLKEENIRQLMYQEHWIGGTQKPIGGTQKPIGGAQSAKRNCNTVVRLENRGLDNNIKMAVTLMNK